MSGNKFVQPASKAIERFLKFLSIPCFRIVSEIDYRNVGFVRECSYQRLHELAVGCDRIDMHKYNIGSVTYGEIGDLLQSLESVRRLNHRVSALSQPFIDRIASANSFAEQ